MASSSWEIGIDEMTSVHGYSVVPPPGGSAVDARWPCPSAWRTLVTGGLHDDLGALGHDLVAADLPHHPGPVLGVLELLDEGGDVLLVPLGQSGR